jgi:hypothetical protein
MKTMILLSFLLASITTFAGLRSQVDTNTLTQAEKSIPKRPPINDEGPGGGGSGK